MSEIGTVVAESALRKETSDLLQQYGEIAIDSFLDEGILRDIPVINTITSVFRSGVAIRDAIFIKKIVHFLKEPSKAPDSKKQKFLDKLRNEPDFRNRFTTHLLVVLDGVNDLRKPPILAKLFEAYVWERLDFSDFCRLCRAVEVSFVDDLQEFLECFEFIMSGPHGVQGIWPADRRPLSYCTEKAKSSEHGLNLLPSGLTALPGTLIGDTGEWVEVKTGYGATRLGYLFSYVMKNAFHNNES